MRRGLLYTYTYTMGGQFLRSSFLFRKVVVVSESIRE